MGNFCFVAFFAAVAIAGASGCGTSRPYTTAVSVLCDVSEKEYTDSAGYRKDRAMFTGFIVGDTSKPGNEGGYIRLTALNALSQNTVHSATLPSPEAGILGSNPLNRKDEINAFQQQVTAIFDNFGRAYRKDAGQSKIYQGLCRELTRLADDKADRKIMVVYSDFLENSALFSLYPPHNLKYLQDPIQFADSVLRQDCPLPNLNGIDIYLVAYRTESNDEAVNQALKFWETVLEHAGARVESGAGLGSIR
ncbi:MAG: hypothetical protein IT262_23800 [Saprospiraceae bacterium]|nr:hypothetical protein [Saprospiraceae bacterium]